MAHRPLRDEIVMADPFLRVRIGRSACKWDASQRRVSGTFVSGFGFYEVEGIHLERRSEGNTGKLHPCRRPDWQPPGTSNGEVPGERRSTPPRGRDDPKGRSAYGAGDLFQPPGRNLQDAFTAEPRRARTYLASDSPNLSYRRFE